MRKGTTRITTATNAMTTGQDHHTNQAEVNLEAGEVTIIIHNCVQRRDQTHLSLISADKPDQIHLSVQSLTHLEAKIRAKT